MPAIDVPTFSFRLVKSSDLSKIAELTQARDRQLQIVLNRAGAFNFRMPLDDSVSKLISEVSTGVQILRHDPDGVTRVKWGGPVWTIDEQTPNTLSVGCVGWLQMLEKRFSKPLWAQYRGATSSGPLTYTDTDAGAIALDLVQLVNTDAGYGNINYIFPGTAEVTRSRTRTYQPFINILTEITSLSDIESGFDLKVDESTRKLNIYQKLQTVRTQVLFEYNGNTLQVGRQTDSSKICNRMIAYSNIGAAQSDNQLSQGLYGLFEEVVALSDVTDIAILQAYANAEVAVRSYPLPFFSFSPRAFSAGNNYDPRIFEDYDIGDIVYLKAKKGRLNIPGRQAVRIFGATVDFLPNGTERVSAIQTTAAA